jgi:hypothetical protein
MVVMDCVMKSIRALHIAVVPDSEQGLVFAAHLRRMGVGKITTVASLHAARLLCWASGVDACIVAMGHATPEPQAALQGDAPGFGCGVPTLMVVARVTPGLRKLARKAGYETIVPAGIAPRMLYRRVRAALQGRGAGGPARSRLPAVMAIAPFTGEWTTPPGKPTLH